MVNAPVQEGAVVAHQQKAVLAAQVIRHQFAAMHVQVVGGLVNQRVHILPGKQRRQQGLGLFAPAEGVKGTVQRVLGHLKQVQFTNQPPVRGVRRGLLHHKQRQLARVRHLKGKVHGRQGQVDAALIGVLPLQQAQQRGFAPAVSGHQPQAPGGVHRKGYMLKHGRIAALIGKGKIAYIQLHGAAPPIWVTG